MNLRLSALFASVLGVSCQTLATAPSAGPTPTHMLRLVCGSADEKPLLSRIAVLDVGDPIYDYGFATGHGVPPKRPCSVKDFSGEVQPADMIHLAEGYVPGEETDWAVIRFNKISTEGLVRYKLQPVENLKELNQQEFAFARARGLPENTQNCKLTLLKFSDSLRRVTHDCQARGGQSGSPLTQIVDGEHRLIGLHIGHLWMLESPATGRPDRKGYINLLDSETINEVEAVIAENRS